METKRVNQAVWSEVLNKIQMKFVLQTVTSTGYLFVFSQQLVVTAYTALIDPFLKRTLIHLRQDLPFKYTLKYL